MKTTPRASDTMFFCHLLYSSISTSSSSLLSSHIPSSWHETQYTVEAFCSSGVLFLYSLVLSLFVSLDTLFSVSSPCQPSPRLSCLRSTLVFFRRITSLCVSLLLQNLDHVVSLDLSWALAPLTHCTFRVGRWCLTSLIGLFSQSSSVIAL